MSELLPTISPSPINFTELLGSNFFVATEYQSNSLVVLRGDEELLTIFGNMNLLWKAIDVVQHYGYSLKEITTSGMGSQGNPTRFYAILVK